MQAVPRRAVFSLLYVGAFCSCAAGGTSPGALASSGSRSGAGESGSGGASGGSSGGYGAFPDAAADSAIPACPPGLACNVVCPGGAKTQITGKVYDPAGKNPLYDVAVYVPKVPLVALPRGVPTGTDACSCVALFKSGAVVSTATAVDGSFTLDNVPVGAGVPLVLQIGKWRRLLHVDVTECAANPQPDRSLTLPSSVPAGDTDDNMPDIAVSTGFADTLECLMRRVGLPASEYVAGAASTGHVHLFSGGQVDSTANMNGPMPGGLAEAPAMPGAPPSYEQLWASESQMMPYDVTLLSCESAETFQANPAVLEAYLNAGGRVYASHYHYAWFAGPLATAQGYQANADWSGLATWATDTSIAAGPVGGVVDTTLNGSGMPFPKGVALQQWLQNVGALGQNSVPMGELSVYQPRFNATLSVANAGSQSWIQADMASGAPNNTMYFSFDTPVNAPLGSDGLPAYCGRAVFSDLHVSGSPSTMDTHPPPGGCQDTDLSPQEKVLEFMLFDLSSCVIPDSVAPSVPVLQ